MSENNQSVFFNQSDAIWRKAPNLSAKTSSDAVAKWIQIESHFSKMREAFLQDLHDMCLADENSEPKKDTSP